jgi:hypothetical protein
MLTLADLRAREVRRRHDDDVRAALEHYRPDREPRGARPWPRPVASRGTADRTDGGRLGGDD